MANTHDPIIWDESYETGVAEIDDQHRILVNTLNEANTRLESEANIELLTQITKDLLSYALYHFETEEELMQDYGYRENATEDADTHRRQHREFSSKVVAVRDGLKAGIPISREELLSFLNGWLLNHIQNTDRKLGDYILQQRKQG